MKKTFVFLFLFGLCSYSAPGFSKDRELLQAQKMWKELSIQHGGRLKPFDTFSREVLRSVYGRDAYNKKSAVEVILSWLIIPDFWNKEKVIYLEKDIKQSLELPVKQKHFSPYELQSHSGLALQLVELQSLREGEEELDSYFKTLEKVETRLILYSAVQSGFLIRLEPSQSDETWLSLPQMTKPVSQAFRKLLSSYIHLISENMSSSMPNSRLKPTEKGESLSSFRSAMGEFQSLVLKESRTPLKIKLEVFYNSFKPFQKAWIFYFLFLMALSGLFVFKREDLFPWLFPFAVVAFASHSLGILLRSYIMSRPPVSNMYETVIWVPWAALIAGFIFYLRGLKLPFTASVILSFFCLLLTSLAPEILSASLQPLEAVLRSSFWLSTHVLVITMSYSFFFLAFVLGDMALISYLIRKKDSLSLVKKLYHPIYRSIQWGLVLLAAGTILGGIWADYSWGRFWGWDPKESWALVSLLAYLALLHGKLAGWIKPFGMSVGAVMMFFSVIMAWYGVNFILGAGLHSYGFGSGGVEYVAGFLVLHIVLCALAGLKRLRYS